MAPTTLMSPRVPGVRILTANATGPQYARWRRGVKAVFKAKGTWGHCDGSDPMPMPESGPNFFSPTPASNTQPGLLEERKSWVKKDREVKLDLFLSVADDIKVDVFDVGPPLPPTAMTALEMMEALDERYHNFKFEDYHHVFCHFLNLHIDQYPNLDDFNNEFQATLDDLLDHNAPMTNVQACSAYFSKLRCTQNPWVAKKLKEWDASEKTPLLKALMKECPPWIVIRPLTTKIDTIQPQSSTASFPEEALKDSHSNHDHSSASDNEGLTDHSDVSTISSQSSHSRQISDASTRSQEITIHASYEDLADLADAFPMPAAKVSSPKRLTFNPSMSNMAFLPHNDRPLPPLPNNPSAASSIRSRSASPNPLPRRLETTLKLTPPLPLAQRPTTPFTRSTSPLPIPSRENSQDDIHPAMRSNTAPTQVPTTDQIHPALRGRTPTTQPSRHIASRVRSNSPAPLQPTVFTPSPKPVIFTSPKPMHRASTPSPPLPPAAFSAPAKPATRTSTPSPSLPQFAFSAPSRSLSPPEISQRPSSNRSMITPENPSDFNHYQSGLPLMSIESCSSSMISLPLQGATTPEYHDTHIVEHAAPPPNPRNFSTSPPRSYVSRLSAESAEDDKKGRKRSWSIKARLSSRRNEVREMI